MPTASWSARPPRLGASVIDTAASTAKMDPRPPQPATLEVNSYTPASPHLLAWDKGLYLDDRPVSRRISNLRIRNRFKGSSPPSVHYNSPISYDCVVTNRKLGAGN
jgi:hypothetical protein